MKRIYETSAGKSLSAWVVLTKGGKHAATVRAHYGQSRVMVEVDNRGKGPQDIQQASAGGYGYDKFTSALTGMVIDGHAMSDHCGKALRPPKGRATWPRDAKAPRGYSFANFVTGAKRWPDSGERMNPKLAEDEEGYSSCYRRPGLDYLKALGYQVIQAI